MPFNPLGNFLTHGQDEVEETAVQVSSARMVPFPVAPAIVEAAAAQEASTHPVPPPATPPTRNTTTHEFTTNEFLPLRCREEPPDYSSIGLTHFFESPHRNTVTTVSTSPGGEYIAVGDDQGHIQESPLPHLLMGKNSDKLPSLDPRDVALEPCRELVLWDCDCLHPLESPPRFPHGHYFEAYHCP